jgi:alpha-beta hydrolase superfamily lysophospholipase
MECPQGGKKSSCIGEGPGAGRGADISAPIGQHREAINALPRRDASGLAPCQYRVFGHNSFAQQQRAEVRDGRVSREDRVDQAEQPSAHDAEGVGSWLVMADGQRLFVRDWRRMQSRGAVLIVHGLGEHSGRYARLAQWFNQRGYAVRSYDQRGHGKSPGQRGRLRHGDDLLADLASVYADYAARLSQPPVLLGHSMGGLVALRTVLDGAVVPSALVLSSPALRSWAAPRLIRLASVLSRLAPRLPLRNGLDADKLSHAAQVVIDYRSDRLRHSWITPRLAHFIFSEGAACIADGPRLAVPTLLLVADSDGLVDPGGSHAFAKAASSTGQLTTRYFATLYHELFNEAEPGRSQVLMQLGDWLGRQLRG